MLRGGKIKWKTYTKTAPVYLHKQSCHDVKVFNGIFKGVALRIRETNSTEEGFNATVEEFNRAFANSGQLAQGKEPAEPVQGSGPSGNN